MDSPTVAQPVASPGAVVWLENDKGRVEPLRQADGQHVFVSKPGTYALHATYSGYRPARLAVAIPPGVNMLPRAMPPSVIVKLQRQE